LGRRAAIRSEGGLMAAFLAMGGYAKWVWSAFGFTLLVLVFNVVSAGIRYRRIARELRLSGSPQATGVRT
jgi:heme exporter protein CcmD